MGTPPIVSGSGGAGGSVPNGVRGLVADVGIARSYGVNGAALAAFAVSLSDDPAALMLGAEVGNAVLLNEGNRENAYTASLDVNTGGPENRSARPCARNALPCGTEPIRVTIWVPAGPTAGDGSSAAGQPRCRARYEARRRS